MNFSRLFCKTTLYNNIEKARAELEESSVESGNTAETVKIVTAVQQYKRMKNNWTDLMSVCKDSQKLLDRQRFQFPQKWLYSEQLEGSWNAFNTILDRKDIQIQEQLGSLQMRMVTEEQNIEQKTQITLQEWETEKPVSKNVSPEKALQNLAIYKKKLGKIADQRGQVSKAKEALELDLRRSAEATEREENLAAAIDELSDLEAVWAGLQDINAQLDQIRETPWPAVQPRNIRKQLDSLINLMKSEKFPTKLRQYNVYIGFFDNLKKLAKINMLIIELKSIKMKDRHWKSLIKELRLGKAWASREGQTLGQIWDIDLMRNEKVIRDILLIAQGEMALEQFLQNTRDTWTNYALEMTQYQTKCKLIRGWDDLFNKLKDDQNSISAMKMSPYYRVIFLKCRFWAKQQYLGQKRAFEVIFWLK